MRESQKTLSEKLTAAVASGDVAAMCDLIAAGADVNCRDAQGFTPLMLAAYSWEIRGDFREGVRLLLDAGADVDAANISGHTALMLASIYGLKDMAKMLVDNRADIDKRSCSGLSAEDMARQNGHADIVALLQKTRAERRSASAERVAEYLKERARHYKRPDFKP